MLATLAAFVLSALVLALIPGPDNLFVLAQSAMRGAGAGVWVTLGLCTGLLVHTAAVALGLAAVLAASPLAFTAIKVGGALYLIVLAWGAFRSAAAPAPLAAGPRRSAAAAYRRGIVMNLTNPKVAMFFLAFLPQFTNPAHGSVTIQLLVLGALFIACTLVVFLSIAIAAGRLSVLLARSPGAGRWLNRGVGLLFLALAARLLLEQP